MNETARARQSLEAIIESSKHVEQQIQLIATAATEQTAASGEISDSAGHISQLATENAQGSEEAVEALKNLASLANDLDRMIGQFQLESSTQPGGSYRDPRPSVRSTPRSAPPDIHLSRSFQSALPSHFSGPPAIVIDRRQFFGKLPGVSSGSVSDSSDLPRPVNFTERCCRRSTAVW